jgi:signal transduction histidine kinase/GAF domain-containing protein
MAVSTFHYRSLSRQFLQEALSELEKQTSILLIGPPNAGKGFFARKLAVALGSQNHLPVIKVNFRRGATNIGEARDVVAQAVMRAGLQVNLDRDGVFASLPDSPTPTYLFVTNPDVLPRELSRLVLHEIWTRIQDGTVVAVVRGEYDMGELVHGSMSEFHAIPQYFIQSIGDDLLEDYLRQYDDVFLMRFQDKTQEELLAQTGGVGDQIRSVLLALIEGRARMDRRPSDRASRFASIEEIQSTIARMSEFGVPDDYFLRQAIQLLSLERSTRVFEDLDSLLKDRTPALDQSFGAPCSLTLSGLAVRKNGALHFSSQLMRKTAIRYLTSSRIAQFHARAGRFEEAFSILRETPVAGTPWNISILTSTVRAASAELYRQASLGREALWGFFTSVCQKLLGLSEVSFWECRTAWEPISAAISPDMRTVCSSALALDDTRMDLRRNRASTVDGFALPGEILLPPGPGTVLGWRLLGLDDNLRFAVFVGDVLGNWFPPQSVLDLLREFANVFQRAHAWTIRVEEEERHGEFLKIESKVVQAIYEQFAESDPSIVDILSEISAFESLGYEHIVCFLTDEWEGKIYEIVPNAKMADDSVSRAWGLQETETNVHGYVYRTKEAFICADVRNDRFTKDDPSFMERQGSLALCPLIGPQKGADALGDAAGPVIGTLEISRSDGKCPSQSEVNDFIALGKKLALFIEQSNRLHLLQSTLDKNREALVIFDSLGQPYYSDTQAVELFNFRRGWTSCTSRQEEVETENKSILAEFGSRAFREGKIAKLYDPFPGMSRVLSVHGDLLQGWRRQPVASFLSILDHTEDYKVFEAFGVVTQASDLETGFARLLEAVKILGHGWARIYRLKSGELRSSKFQYGLNGDAKADFESGRIVLDGRESRRCLRENKVIVFCKTQMDGEFYTSLGLKVRGITKTNGGIVRKEKGEYWIEAPLIAGQEQLGTISLECSSNIREERIAFLQAFFGLVSRLLEALSRSSRERFEVVGQGIAVYSHILLSQVTWLGTLQSLYKRLEKDFDPDRLRRYNDMFLQNQSGMDDDFARVIDSFKTRAPRYKQFDLLQLLQRVYAAVGTQFEVTSSKLPIEADEQDISNVFLELLSNSKKFKKTDLRFVIRVSQSRIDSTRWYSIEVEDNGPGFAPHMKQDETAFYYFTRHEPGVPSQPWAGLGLAMVKKKVEDHGGGVEIIEAAGACIRIRLPRSKSDRGLNWEDQS